MRQRIAWWPSVVLAVVGLGLWGAPAPAADEIVLGSAISQTGKYAREGKFYVDAYSLTVDAINKAGGVKVGGKPYKLVLKHYDDQSVPNLAVRLFTKLVTSDKVNFLLGPYSSGITIPASAVAEKYEVPMVQGGGASDKIFDRGYKYIFGTLPRAELYFQAAIEAAAKMTPRVHTAALLYSNEAFDRSVAEGTRQWLKDQKIDFIRQSQAADVNPKMAIFTVGPPTADFRKTLGRAAEYVYGITPWLPEMDVGGEIFKSARDFDRQFQERFGYAADYHVASGAADVLAFKLAIEKAGVLDPKKVRDALAALDAETLYGRIKFEPTGQIALSQVLVQIQDGKIVPIYVSGKMAGKPVYPTPPWGQRK